MSEKTIYEVMESISKLTIKEMFEPQTEIHYQHKEKPEIIITDAKEFVSKGLNGADFKEIKETNYLRSEVLKSIFGTDKKPTPVQRETIKQFAVIMDELSSKREPKEKKLKAKLEEPKPQAKNKK